MLVRLRDQLVLNPQLQVRLRQRLLEGGNAILLALHHDLHHISFRLIAAILRQPLMNHRDACPSLARRLTDRKVAILNLRDQSLLQLVL